MCMYSILFRTAAFTGVRLPTPEESPGAGTQRWTLHVRYFFMPHWVFAYKFPPLEMPQLVLCPPFPVYNRRTKAAEICSANTPFPLLFLCRDSPSPPAERREERALYTLSWIHTLYHSTQVTIPFKSPCFGEGLCHHYIAAAKFSVESPCYSPLS